MHLILCLFANMLIQSALYELPLQRIDGTSINLQTYQGKKILFVNTASGSPLASQYAGLDSLQRLYADSLVVIVLPSNSFGNEPLTPVSIGTSLEAAYHPQFIIGEKMEVRGAGKSALYQWLTEKAHNGRLSNEAGSDFFKFLVDGSGEIVGVFGPSVKPMSEELTSAL